jgi:hypothetical protein
MYGFHIFICIGPYYGHMLHSFLFCSHGQSTAHIMRETISTFHVVFGMQKDSIFTSKFGVIIRSLNEAGLVSKWMRDEELCFLP